MWKSFLILFIVIINLCTLINSYKIITDDNSKTAVIETYDQQDFDHQEKYAEENYPIRKSYKESNDQVKIIGKWRNNGEALEPKWRDGDSVPLAPFSTISFRSGWRRDSDSLENYEIEQETYDENVKKGARGSSKGKQDIFNEHDLPEESYKSPIRNSKSNSKPFEYRDYNPKPINYELNFDKSNSMPETYSSENRPGGIRRFSSSFRGQEVTGSLDNINKNTKGATKYRETLENYPTEYELFESENDGPRPRKRRPPQNYEFSESSNAANGKIDENEQSPKAEDQLSTMENRRSYLTTIKESNTLNKNRTKSQENEELKTFLKMQAGNLSLSEILQEKNLTLADLLKGKPNVINILKSGDRLKSQEKYTADIESISTEVPKIILNNFTYGHELWSPSQVIVTKSYDENTNFKEEKTSLKIDTTILPITITDNKNSELISTTTEKSTNGISLFNNTKFNDDELRNSSVEIERMDDETPDSVKTMKNDEGLLPDEEVSIKFENEKLMPNNEKDDEDEIMEFSDYPAKVPKFIVPIYDVATRNVNRKNIPLSTVRTKVPEEDSDLKLSIEQILSSEKKTSTIINNTDYKNFNETMIDGTSTGNFEKQNINEEGVKNETHQMELIEKETENSNSNSMKDKSKPGDRKNLHEDLIKMEPKNGENYSTQDTNEFSTPKNLPMDEKDNMLNQKLHEVVIPKVDPQSRAEILELFSSGSSAERLERLLASRNMSIEELIALRQRGSSQVHFAEIFKMKGQISPPVITKSSKFQAVEKSESIKENKMNESKENTEESHTFKENNEIPNIKNISNAQSNQKNLTNAENISVDKRKEIFNTDGEYLATDLLNLFSKSEDLRKNISKFDKIYTGIDNPAINSDIKSHKAEPDMKPKMRVNLDEDIENLDTMEFAALPGANNVQKDSQGSSYYTSIEEVELPIMDREVKKIEGIFEGKKIVSINSSSTIEIGRVEEILKNDLNLLNNVYGVNNYNYSGTKPLSKVKPSIIASGGILGVTIVVFLSIFIACRIQQKKKSTYRNSFSTAVFNNPVTNARKLSNTSSINTIMVDVVATSTAKRHQKQDIYDIDDFEQKRDIDDDSLDANDSWETIPDFMK